MMIDLDSAILQNVRYDQRVCLEEVTEVIKLSLCKGWVNELPDYQHGGYNLQAEGTSRQVGLEDYNMTRRKRLSARA